MVYNILADLVLLLHVVFVAFVVLTVPLVLLGGLCKWPWVKNRWLRFIHLLAIVIVAGQSWAGVLCPLTTLEMWLRLQAGQLTYSGSFVSYWLQNILFWNFPDWVFITIYTIFALLVLLTLWLIPVEKRTTSEERLTQKRTPLLKRPDC